MSREQSPKPICFVTIPFAKEFEGVHRAVGRATAMARFKVVRPDAPPKPKTLMRETLVAQIAGSDLVVADLTGAHANVLFEVGMAEAMGKQVILLLSRRSEIPLPFDLQQRLIIHYEPPGDELHRELRHLLRELRHAPQQAGVTSGARLATPFFVDWDRLDRADAENLCRELLTQMGLRRVHWYKESPEIDLIAEYPRKDPDGFEYRELWLVSMGRHMPVEMLLDMTAHEPEMFVHHMFRSEEQMERYWSGEESSPITFLFIALRTSKSDPDSDMLRRRMARHPRSKRHPFSVRMRLWDRDDLTALVQQFPNIGYKYFSDEARSLAKYRKGPEELYAENLDLTKQLTDTNEALEAEKNRRVRAERDSVWKDISFSAAHKLGNPIFAIETDLEPLRKRIREDRESDALECVSNIGSAVDKAKSIVEQFKSLTKAQQINPVPTALRPILDDSCAAPKSQDVQCDIDCPPELTVLGDPERLAEVFDELSRNALHWIGEGEKRITIKADVVGESALLSGLDTSAQYVRTTFQDNGPGIPVQDKDRIFEAFVTTQTQGTGLGLALVRRIIEGHGGMVRETGLPGKGAEFEIYLPRPTEGEV